MEQVRFKNNFKATIFVLFLLIIAISTPTLVFAQEKSADEMNMQILQDKMKADKKLLVSENMTLTDAESKVFWPIYEDYQKELQALNQRLEKSIESYAVAYNANTLTDEAAQKLIEETIAIDESEAQMRKGYAAKLAKVLPGKKVARYLQIENKVRAIVRYGLAAEIPLME